MIAPSWEKDGLSAAADVVDIEPCHDVETFLAKHLGGFRHRQLERDVEDDAAA